MYLSLRPDLDAALDSRLPGAWSEDTSERSTSSRHAPYSNQSRSHRYQRGSQEPHRGRYEPTNPAYKVSRDKLRDIANSTLDTIDEGWYMPPGADELYNIGEKIKLTNEKTGYYPPDDADIASWATADLGIPETSANRIKLVVKEYSTLVGARRLHSRVHMYPGQANKTIGVLNFASAKKPGGGFLNGAQAQEESIARVSTLYPSLISHTARTFYSHYAINPENAFYNHAMIYSPGVVIMRDDKGVWKKPVEIDVLTSAAVNAGDVRKQVEEDFKMRALIKRVRAAEAAREKREREEAAEEFRRIDEKIKRAADKARRKAGEDHQQEQIEQKGQEAVSVHDQDVEMGEPTDEGHSIKPETNDQAQDTNMEASTLDDVPVVQESTQQDVLSSQPSFDTILNPPPPDEDNPPELSLQETSTEIVELPLKDLLALAEQDIEEEMKERIARVLFLFYKRGAQHLVLGSFGTGVFQNSVELVARIFFDLLARPDSKFYGAFENVVFAILGEGTVKVFQNIFRDVVSQEVDEDELEPESESEGLQDGKGSEESKVDGPPKDDELSKVDIPPPQESKDGEQQKDNEHSTHEETGIQLQSVDDPEEDWVVVPDKDPQPEAEATLSNPAHMDKDIQSS